MTDELKQWEYDKGYDRGYAKGKADILDVIRAEIVDFSKRLPGIWFDYVVKIIDKYKAESADKE